MNELIAILHTQLLVTTMRIPGIELLIPPQATPDYNQPPPLPSPSTLPKQDLRSALDDPGPS